MGCSPSCLRTWDEHIKHCIKKHGYKDRWEVEHDGEMRKIKNE